MIKTVICYKTKEPIYYNKGTEWESNCDTFLDYYTDKTLEEAITYTDNLNTLKPECYPNGEKIDWETIEYFFAHEQEEMY